MADQNAISSHLLLIVEDDVVFRELIRSAILDIGVKALLADNAGEALEILGKHRIDAVLSDIDLRDSSGLELLHAMRKLRLRMPLLFLTGNADASNAQEALRLGAADFLAKPILKKDLQAAVGRALRLGDLQRANECDQLLVARRKARNSSRGYLD